MVDPKQISRILGGTPGIPAWGDCAFFVDAGDPSSVPSSVSPVVDIYDVTGRTPKSEIQPLGSIDLVDSHLRFSTGTDRLLLTQDRPPDLIDLFDGGGTLSFWVRVDSGVDSFGRLADSRGIGFDRGYYFAIVLGSTGGFNLAFVRQYTTTSGDWRLTTPNNADVLPYDRWVNITISFTDAAGDGNPGTVPAPTILIDGVAVDVVENTPPNGTPVSDSGVDLRFGNRAGNGRDFVGDMDMIAAWNRELSQEEGMQFFAATRSRFQGGSGLQLLDHVEVSASTASITFNALDSSRDGAYLVVGKLITPGGIGTGLYELRPVTGGALSGIDSDFDFNAVADVSASALTSTTGWIVAYQETGEGNIAATTTFFQAWIWPDKARFGSSGDSSEIRLFNTYGSAWRDGGIGSPLRKSQGVGRWLNTNSTSPFESMTLNGSINIEPGSEFSIYRLKPGRDPQ